MAEKSKKPKLPKHHLRKILFLIPIVIFVYYFRPWFHEIFMFFYRTPIVVELLVILGILHYFVFRKKQSKLNIPGRRALFGTFTLTLLIVFLIFASFFSTLMPQLHIVNEFDYKAIEELPETKKNIRLMPYEVAYRYSKDSLQLSQYKLGTENIANINGDLSWMFPLIPDGPVLQFLLKNKGVVFVDATTQAKNTNAVWEDLNIGEGMLVFDNLYWNTYKEKYWIDLDDPFYIPHNDKIYTVIPAISYSYHHFFGLLYTVPRFEGVVLIDSEGNRQFLSPEEARQKPFLKKNRIFPENLARYYVKSYVYNNGLINKWFIHKDQIDVQDINPWNKQPFLMDTSEGLKWFISTEPYGESHGIFKIFLVDGVTGEIQKYELPIEETLTGPIKGMDFVRRENPIVDWNKFKMVEPLPFIRDNKLYWKVVVIPNDAAGIAYQTFVNSKSNDVIKFETDEQVQGFIKSEVKKTTQPTKNQTKTQKIQQIKQKIKEIEDLLDEIE